MFKAESRRLPLLQVTASDEPPAIDAENELLLVHVGAASVVLYLAFVVRDFMAEDCCCPASFVLYLADVVLY